VVILKKKEDALSNYWKNLSKYYKIEPTISNEGRSNENGNVGGEVSLQCSFGMPSHF
jgi:hypothetical protein